ncbi:hypothetical protein PIB30_094434 [Stylosanthes scabra]|uniref:NB-ARC domain-containing protein n=1 Tax=Stylosanthes scabra TaxID=79078 RepID=A0ABU6TW03_9FABA|nr:hypothetical protein [Stylosanthes scabra]
MDDLVGEWLLSMNMYGGFGCEYNLYVHTCIHIEMVANVAYIKAKGSYSKMNQLHNLLLANTDFVEVNIWWEILPLSLLRHSVASPLKFPNKNNSVAEWLRQLTEAFDDAGDILDEIEYEARRNEVVRMYGSISMKVCRFFSYTSNPLVFCIRMAHKIRDMKQKIDQKANEGRTLGIVEQHVNTPTLERNLPWRETSSSLSLRVYGRNEEKEKIIQLLIGQQSEPNNVDVISIVGIGGLWKTTLAQMVYDDARVKQHFNMLMWVCESDNFDVKRLLQRIVHAASKTENVVDANSSLEHMVSLLDEKLCGKKFLLVLDDVWNENHNKWDELRNYLLKAGVTENQKGAKS